MIPRGFAGLTRTGSPGSSGSSGSPGLRIQLTDKEIIAKIEKDFKSATMTSRTKSVFDKNEYQKILTHPKLYFTFDENQKDPQDLKKYLVRDNNNNQIPLFETDTNRAKHLFNILPDKLKFALQLTKEDITQKFNKSTEEQWDEYCKTHLLLTEEQYNVLPPNYKIEYEPAFNNFNYWYYRIIIPGASRYKVKRKEIMDKIYKHLHEVELAVAAFDKKQIDAPEQLLQYNREFNRSIDKKPYFKCHAFPDDSDDSDDTIINIARCVRLSEMSLFNYENWDKRMLPPDDDKFKELLQSPFYTELLNPRETAPDQNTNATTTSDPASTPDANLNPNPNATTTSDPASTPDANLNPNPNATTTSDPASGPASGGGSKRRRSQKKSKKYKKSKKSRKSNTKRK